MINKKFIPLVIIAIIGITLMGLELIKNKKEYIRLTNENNSILAKYSAELENRNNQIQKLKQSLSVKEKTDIVLIFTKKDIAEDIIKNYPSISNSIKKEIINSLFKVSEKYNINPLILYSLIHTESSMRYWIEHRPTYITIKNKKIKVRAVGLGGVVWEWWGDKLKKAMIVEARSDLFIPSINIQATAFIYNELRKLKLHPKAKNKSESAMIRYFGGGYTSYFKKIDKKISIMLKVKLYNKLP